MPLSSDIDGAVKKTNTANQLSPIWEYTVPVDSEIVFPVEQRIEAKFYSDAAGNTEISPTSRLIWGVIQPHKRAPIYITKELLYRKLRQLDPSEQADRDKAVIIEAENEFKSAPVIIVQKQRKLVLYIDSPDQVDWTASYFNLPDAEVRGAE